MATPFLDSQPLLSSSEMFQISPKVVGGSLAPPKTLTATSPVRTPSFWGSAEVNIWDTIESSAGVGEKLVDILSYKERDKNKWVYSPAEREGQPEVESVNRCVRACVSTEGRRPPLDEQGRLTNIGIVMCCRVSCDAWHERTFAGSALSSQYSVLVRERQLASLVLQPLPSFLTIQPTFTPFNELNLLYNYTMEQVTSSLAPPRAAPKSNTSSSSQQVAGSVAKRSVDSVHALLTRFNDH